MNRTRMILLHKNKMCQQSFVETFYYTKNGDDKVYQCDVSVTCSCTIPIRTRHSLLIKSLTLKGTKMGYWRFLNTNSRVLESGSHQHASIIWFRTPSCVDNYENNKNLTNPLGVLPPEGRLLPKKSTTYFF